MYKIVLIIGVLIVLATASLVPKEHTSLRALLGVLGLIIALFGFYFNYKKK